MANNSIPIGTKVKLYRSQHGPVGTIMSVNEFNDEEVWVEWNKNPSLSELPENIQHVDDLLEITE